MNHPLAGATRTGPLRLLVFMCSAAFLVALSTAASARVTRCDTAWVSCNMNSNKCSNDTRCMQRCDQKYSKCNAGSASLQFDQPVNKNGGNLRTRAGEERTIGLGFRHR